MSKAVQKFLKIFQSHKDQKKDMGSEVISTLMSAIQSIQGMLTAVQVQQLGTKIDKIQQLLLLKEVASVKPAFGGPAVDVDKALKNLRERRFAPDVVHPALEKIAVNRHNPKTKELEYLLHRATENAEYAKSARPLIHMPDQPKKVHVVNEPSLKAKIDPHSEPTEHEARPTDFETERETTWVLDFVTAEKKRQGANPIVSCWIPKTAIVDVSGITTSVGTWGSLGANPHARECRIEVKPGKYTIFQELKS